MSFRSLLRTRFVAAAILLAAAVIALAAAVFTGGSAGGRPAPVADIDAILRRAIDDMEAGDLQAAEHGLAAVLDAEPSQPEALVYAGELARERGNPDAAVALWRRIPDSAGQACHGDDHREDGRRRGENRS